MIKKAILKALLLLYLGASWITATHLHAPHEHHHADCKVCHILKTFQSADLPPVANPLAFDTAAFERIGSLAHLCDLGFIKGFFSHAPPTLR